MIHWENYPTNQITEDQRVFIPIAIQTLTNLHGISSRVVADIYRAAYESGWNDAVETPGAKGFSRLGD